MSTGDSRSRPVAPALSAVRSARAAWPRLGWCTGLAAAGAAAIILVCTANSLCWINRPFPGFFLWENLFVPAIGDTDWSGHEAGVPYGSQLVSMGGRPVRSAAAVYDHAATLPLGTPVVYAFALESGERVTVAVPTMRLNIPEYLWTLGTYLVIGVLLSLLGFVVYVLRPDAPAARAMLYAGVAWGLYFVTAADIFGPAWFRPLCLVLQALSPVALAHLALTFPVERGFLRRLPRLLPASYVAALIVGVVGNLVLLGSLDGTLLFNRAHALASLAAGVLLLVLLAQSFIVPPSAAVRQRIKIAVLGGCAAFILPVVGVALFALAGVSFPLNFLALPLALFPAAIGYAIVKHDLFEVDAIIRRTIAWAVLSLLIALLYLGGVGALDVIFSSRGGRIAQLLFLLAIVGLVNPVRNRVQNAVDYLFARDRYDYRRAVGEASQALAAMLDVEAVVGRILRTITETLHIEFGAVWLRDGTTYDLEAVAGSRRPAALPERLGEHDALVTRLQRDPQVIVAEDAPVPFGDGNGIGDTEFAGASLVVPMAFERRLGGFIALGGKESGAFYSREDLGLLRTLANQGAVAVENARSYRALVHANEDLRAAQSRLIETERFAAIGELSAAVAHGIRNPLAGIKAAAQFASLDLPPDHPLHENIRDIIGEADKLEARIRTLLDFSKPFEPRPAACRVEAIVEGAVASLRTQMGARGIELATDIAPGIPDVVVDYAQIEQVLLALLSNAVEAMPGGGHIAVAAQALPDGDRVRVAVTDTGPGIPADQLPRVFKLFFTTKSSGTGFGLAVAKTIVERHGGTIAVESALGKGTQFTIELPVGQAATDGSR